MRSIVHCIVLFSWANLLKLSVELFEGNYVISGGILGICCLAVAAIQVKQLIWEIQQGM